MLHLVIKKYRYCFFLFICLLTVGCGQLSSLQTAKVVGKKQATIGGAVLGYGIHDNNVQGGELGSGVVPQVEVLGRYGFSDNFDMGLKLSTGGNIFLDGKLQFAGDANSRFAAAIGGGLEFQMSNFNENIVLRSQLPVYFSFHPSEKSGIYAAPRYVFQYVSNDDNSCFLGGSLGYVHRFSDKFSGLLEGSFYQPFTQGNGNEDTSVFQFGVGVLFHL